MGEQHCVSFKIWEIERMGWDHEIDIVLMHPRGRAKDQTQLGFRRGFTLFPQVKEGGMYHP